MGRSMAELFAQEGANVVITARHREKLDEVVEAVRSQGGRAVGVVADVCSTEDTKKVFAAALDAREAALSDPSQPDVAISPLSAEERPWLLFYTDVSVGPDLWGLTPYYGKDSVVVVERQ